MNAASVFGDNLMKGRRIMEYRSMDKLGIKTSLLGFGCMRFPTENGKINEPEAEKLLDRAIDAGVNYIDTAYPYHGGESEPFTGRVLKKYPRSSFYLATKLPCWEVNSLDDAKRIFNEQLERLDVDYVDFYLLHSMSKNQYVRMKELGVVDYVASLKEAGKIKYYGFSFHDSYSAFEFIIKDRQWDFCQIQLNYMDTDEQAGIKGYELAKELDVPLIIMEPVKGGSLANLPDEILSPLKNEIDCSAASWALRWVGSFDNVKVILSGMSDMSQVEDNIATFTDYKPLNDSQMALVADAASALRKRVYNSCTGCNYCMPCPAGVNIPYNFSIWNTYGIYNNKWGTLWQWKNDIKDEQKAKNCVECGQCEEACPQKISIRKDLAALQAQLDGLENT